MKFFYFTILSMIIFSCGGKKDDNQRPQDIYGDFPPIYQELQAKDDNDSDGISNEQEIKNGTDPDIAQIPIVSLREVENIKLKLFLEHTDKELTKDYIFSSSPPKSPLKANFNVSNNSLVYHKVQKLLYKRHFSINASSTDYPHLDDLISTEIGCLVEHDKIRKWKHQELFSVAPINKFHLGFDYSYHFENMDGVKSLSNLSTSGFLSDELESDINKLIIKPGKLNFENLKTLKVSEKFSFKNIYSNLTDINLFNNCLYFKADNFSYVFNDRKLDYAKIKSGVTKNNAQIIFIKNEEVSWESINPKKFKNIFEYLKARDVKLEIDSQDQILMLDNLLNEINNVNLVDSLSKEILSKKKWFFISSTNLGIREGIQNGQTYIFSYSSGLEILKHSDSFDHIYSGQVTNSLELNDLHVSDTIWVEVKYLSKINTKGDETGFIAGIQERCVAYDAPGRGEHGNHKSTQSCDRYAWIKEPYSCQFLEKNKDNHSNSWQPILAEDFQEEDLYIKFNGERKEFHKLDNGSLGIEFPVANLKSFQSILLIEFPLISKKDYSYTRTRNETHRSDKRHCSYAPRTFEVNDAAKRSFMIDFNIYRNGKIR